MTQLLHQFCCILKSGDRTREGCQSRRREAGMRPSSSRRILSIELALGGLRPRRRIADLVEESLHHGNKG